MKLKIKRVYDKPKEEDGIRILVDRLWPRGLTKEKAHIDIWLKDIGPKTELRKWFGHEPSRWLEFRIRYILELKNNKEQLNQIKQQITNGMVTLVFGAKDEKHNEAVIIEEFLINDF